MTGQAAIQCEVDQLQDRQFGHDKGDATIGGTSSDHVDGAVSASADVLKRALMGHDDAAGLTEGECVGGTSRQGVGGAWLLELVLV